MIFRLFETFFQRRKEARAADKAAAELLLGMLENEAATSKMQADARASNEPYVLLTPTVPITGQTSSGWFGGAPHLPDDVPWPDIEGEPLRFVCQIDLSALPINIWSGLGPRKGWLAVFLHRERMTPKVLHVDGILRKRKGPGQADAAWYWPRLRDGEKPLRPHLPEWPFMMTGHVGELPPPSGWRKGKAPNFPDPQETESRDLSNAAFHPFNEATLVALIDSLAEYFESQARRIGNFLKKKIRDDDRTEFVRFKELADRSLEQFSSIRNKVLPFTQSFDSAPVGELVSQLAALPTYELSYLKDDEDGYAVVSYSQLRLCDKPSDRVGWYPGYAYPLERHARYAYTRNPETVPAELRRRMETIWQFDALHERGAMGHAPLGHVYTPHGPATKNEVLLELPTSNMVGWIWGDTYSIVLFIDRKALARGDFSSVTFDITN
jgi:Domain of unknown function (DUF1963)